jgi:muramidase (phage lysozyme)
MSPNLIAFLDTIRACEGTATEDGYRALFGYTPSNHKTFLSFATHPRVRTYETHDEFIHDGKLEYTTAAGAYQITATTFDRLNKEFPHRWSDFSTKTQDEMAAELIHEAHAFADADAGRLQKALDKCANIWASLPASRYGQPKRRYVFAESVFKDAGGKLA